MDRRKDAGVTAAEKVDGNEIHGCASLRLIVVVPLRAVPAAAPRHLFGRQPEQEEVPLAGGLGHLDRGAIGVPSVSAPFNMNFILEVPLAS